MNASRYLLVGCLLAASLGPSQVSAGVSCAQTATPGVEMCTAGIQSKDIKNIAQEKSNLCWAASAAMIFAHHGHEVSQEEIVRLTKGGVVNEKASGKEVSEALSREYTDKKGKRFRAKVRTFDVPAGKAQISNRDVISELKAGRPLLYGTSQHAMMLTSVTYLEGGGAVAVKGGTVRDPWPDPKTFGRRNLATNELAPMYVAQVVIEELKDESSDKSAKKPADDPPPKKEPKAPPPSNPCMDQCIEARTECFEEVVRLQDCLEDEESACIEKCVDRGGRGPNCVDRCEIDKNEESWTPICERRIEKEKRACRSAYETCKEKCTPD